MNYDDVITIARAHVGDRLRVTSPNGFQHSGEVGLWRNRYSGEEHPTLGDNLMGGEYDGMVSVEVMAENGRYVEARA